MTIAVCHNCDMENRTCRTCHVQKCPSEFWRQPGRTDGLQSECKVCMQKRTNAFHAAHREDIRPRNNAATTKRRLTNPKNALLISVKSRAKMRGMEFSITENDLEWPERCPVLGIPLTFGLGQGHGISLSVRDARFSIDRIDNARGYVPGNVVVVSFRANRLKSDADAIELMKVAQFYGQLETEKIGQADMPDVQPHSQKETGDMSLGNGEA